MKFTKEQRHLIYVEAYRLFKADTVSDRYYMVNSYMCNALTEAINLLHNIELDNNIIIELLPEFAKHKPEVKYTPSAWFDIDKAGLNKRDNIFKSIIKETNNFNDILDSEDFYNLMQYYRNSPVQYQDQVTKSFENVKNYIRNNININDDGYTIVTWADGVQDLMEEQGFNDNSHLINDEAGLEKYGSSAYFVNTKWLNNNK